VSPNEATVAQVMTHVVETIDQNATISDAMLEMCTHGVRRLGVTSDGGGLIGVLSIDDVITALGSDWALLAGILRSETERERSGALPKRPVSQRTST
jgi:signal-transduction protein with cAMP-binding, CBS, and nucleotidyltransferase domain